MHFQRRGRSWECEARPGKGLSLARSNLAQEGKGEGENPFSLEQQTMGKHIPGFFFFFFLPCRGIIPSRDRGHLGWEWPGGAGKKTPWDCSEALPSLVCPQPFPLRIPQGRALGTCGGWKSKQTLKRVSNSSFSTPSSSSSSSSGELLSPAAFTGLKAAAKGLWSREKKKQTS